MSIAQDDKWPAHVRYRLAIVAAAAPWLALGVWWLS